MLRGDDDRGDNDGEFSLSSPPVKENESLSKDDCLRTAPEELCARRICAFTAY